MLYFFLRKVIFQDMKEILKRNILSIFILCLSSGLAWAQKPSFILPVECKLDEDCWLVNYVDVNPEENIAEDFRCGPKSFDTHKGTDIGLRSRAEMRKGVNVLAAADGKILRFRDGEPDSVKTREEQDQLRELRKECGNGIFIDHSGGLQTIYCHLKQESISVESGDNVKAGDIIGQVGQSGIADFPHLHFGIIWENGIVDPFTGHLNTEGCGKFKQTLWADEAQMTYDPVAIYDGGFRSTVPDFEKIKDGEANPAIMRNDGEALVFWASFFGLRKNDKITLEIVDSQGRMFKKQEITQDKDIARQFYYTGRKLQGGTIPPGLYTGRVIVEREGLEPEEKMFNVELR